MDVVGVLRGVLATETAVLRSPLPKDEVEKRLKAAIDSRWRPFGSRPVIGVVRHDRVWFRQRPGRVRNSFQTVMFARIETQGSGTLIIGRSGMAPAAMMFLIAFTSVAALMAVIFTAVALTRQLDGMGPPWWNWLQPLAGLGFVAFGVALGVFGRWLARREHDFLVDFLAATTEAEVLRR